MKFVIIKEHKKPKNSTFEQIRVQYEKKIKLTFLTKFVKFLNKKTFLY